LDSLDIKYSKPDGLELVVLAVLSLLPGPRLWAVQF